MTRATMLPNLSSLSKLTLHVDVKRGREEAGLDTLPNRWSTAVRKLTREPLKNIDWKHLLKKMLYMEDDDTPFVFAVYIPRPGDKQWRVKFQLDAFTISIQADGTDEYCFEAHFMYNKQDYNIEISSLFDMRSDTLALCNVKPNIKDNAGYGSAVLQALDIIAGSLGGHISLTDAAMFRNMDTTPTVNIDYSLTETLSLLRGFGFYEARGFIWRGIFDNEKDKALFAAAQEVELEWTHMVVTTPINQLKEAVLSFHTRVFTRGNTVPAFTQRVYSQDFCEAHAKKITETIDKFKDFLAYDFLEICPEKLGAKSYADVSMRALAQATMNGLIRADSTWDADDISRWLKKMFEDVWRRPHSELKMVKVLYKSSDGSLFYNAVVPNPHIPGGVPVVQMQPLRTDVEVEYNESELDKTRGPQRRVLFPK